MCQGGCYSGVRGGGRRVCLTGGESCLNGIAVSPGTWPSLFWEFSSCWSRSIFNVDKAASGIHSGIFYHTDIREKEEFFYQVPFAFLWAILYCKIIITEQLLQSLGHSEQHPHRGHKLLA